MHTSLPGSWYLAGGQTGERQVMGKVGSAARDQRVNMLQGLHKEGLAYMTIMCMGNRRSSYAPHMRVSHLPIRRAGSWWYLVRG